MARRIFISYQHADQPKAKGFNLMRYAKNLDLDFVGRHLLDPVKSKDPAYITRNISEQMKGTSVSVFLVGKHTADSSWVQKEVEMSREKGNGMVAIRLEPGVSMPDGLQDAEKLDWYEPGDVAEFGPAIERAAQGAVQGPKMATSVGLGSNCAR